MSWPLIVAEVEQRAAGRCEYCQMHQSLQGATFHVEHIVPAVQGGPSTLSNLAWACPGCNLHKSDRTEVADPDTGESVPLFHPREHVWSEHFAWNGFWLLGLTAIGHRPRNDHGLASQSRTPPANPTGRATLRPIPTRQRVTQLAKES